MRNAFSDHGALARGVFSVAVLVSLTVLFTPGSDVPTAPPGVDKVVHGLLFAVLALSGRWAGVRRPVLAGLLALYAAVSEVVQGLAPLDRSASVGDVLADVAGLLIGLAVGEALARRRAVPH
jgi:hypothetical protein